jgi:hypothetical protein
MPKYSDFVVQIMDPRQDVYAGIDGRDTFLDMVSSLIIMTGSERGAIHWIFHPGGYTEVAKDDVCVNLAHGNFWTLSVYHDWLRVLEQNREICPDLIAECSRGRADQRTHDGY